MLSRNQVTSAIHHVMELRVKHETRYLTGYEDGLRWVSVRMKGEAKERQTEFERVRSGMIFHLDRLIRVSKMAQEGVTKKSAKEFFNGKLDSYSVMKQQLRDMSQ